MTRALQEILAPLAAPPITGAASAFAVGFPSGRDGDDTGALRAAVDRVTGELPESLRDATLKRRAEFWAGRHCLRQALTALGWGDPTPIGIGPHREPLIPANYVGAVTHTRGYAWAAAARTEDLAGLGVDAEGVVDARRAAVLRDRVLRPEELEEVGSRGLEEHAHLTMIFSAKESIYKALFPTVRRFFGFEAARLIEIDGAAGVFRWELTEELAPVLPTGSSGDGSFHLEDDRVHTAVMWRSAPP
jgi:enterobactin synthetase component D